MVELNGTLCLWCNPFPIRPAYHPSLVGMFFCSGTTGTPKGVLLSHTNLVSGVSGALHMITQSKLGLGPKDSMLSYLPLAHVYGRILEEVVLSMGGHIGYWRVRYLISIIFLYYFYDSLKVKCLICCCSFMFSLSLD